jgi:DNA adenine methylase
MFFTQSTQSGQKKEECVLSANHKSNSTFPEAMNSPFRYAGGKFYARNLILPRLPKHDFYCEPFAGGASIFFAKHKAKESWLNDADEELVNTYLHIRDYPEELSKVVSREIPSKERHTYYKNEFKPNNDFERAVRWYFLNRTSYSGIMNMVNCYWGYGDKFSMRPENWTRNILRTSNKLQGVKLSNLDFEDVISHVPNNSFLFIDPPYFNADQDKFYTKSFSTDDHYHLSEVLFKNRKRFKFFLTYDNTDEVLDMYEWANYVEPAEWNYTISRTDDQTISKAEREKNKVKRPRDKGKEVFILNYQPIVQEALFA